MNVAVCQLQDVCAITMGKAPEAATYNVSGVGLPFIAGAGDFGPDYPQPTKFTSAPTKICTSGDIIVSIRATIGTKVLSNGIFCLGRGVAALHPAQALDQRYLWHWLSFAEPALASRGRGAIFPQVLRNDIGSLEIRLPAIDEQRRIASILDRADVLCRKQRRASSLTSQVVPSIFEQNFVTESSDSWPVVSVGELCSDVRTGTSGSRLLHSEFVDDGVAVLGIDNVVTNEFRWAARRHITAEKHQQLLRFTVRPKDLLITMMGHCGRCAIMPENAPIAIITKHLCCLTLDQAVCLPEYLQAAFLQDPDLLKQLGVHTKGAIMPGLKPGLIKSLRLRLPPLSAQQAFVGACHASHGLTLSQRSQKALLIDLFNSLQYRALSGRL